MSKFQRQMKAALSELGGALTGVDESAIEAGCETLARARHIGVAGCGRELLQMKGFAMRLFHLGLPVSIVGDVTMPPLGKGDVFLVAAGPGELATMTALMNVAKNAGAYNLLITAQPESSAGRLADSMIVIPAQTMASDQGEAKTSVLPMGSVFEGALFVLFEVMVLRLKTLLGVSPEAMRARHTNME
ncbi:SIS domain-containing protein [Pseudaminobacter sp. 19-2017]|uniref:SIS domain-containing protein n=1 Tax=Pseudaminobacter soli (ex Zhang et al. 2022) TaxID=2831468 RepID=A0A942I8M8_9HYPH|nr:SIS domain-containing protein [Pseudaminobacter soli]MBS3649520.1 SIS domain-containing protein [Pseudaminobacter soli]